MSSEWADALTLRIAHGARTVSECCWRNSFTLLATCASWASSGFARLAPGTETLVQPTRSGSENQSKAFMARAMLPRLGPGRSQEEPGRRVTFARQAPRHARWGSKRATLARHVGRQRPHRAHP